MQVLLGSAFHSLAPLPATNHAFEPCLSSSLKMQESLHLECHVDLTLSGMWYTAISLEANAVMAEVGCVPEVNLRHLLIDLQIP